MIAPLPPLRIGIVGSRGWPQELNHLICRAAVRDLWIGQHNDGRSHVIVTGDARGVDQLARVSARQALVPLTVFCASAQSPRLLAESEGPATYIPASDWEVDGRSAGHKRNRVLVKNVDQLFAFWDGRSPGTRSGIELARKAGIFLCVVRPDRSASYVTAAGIPGVTVV